MNKDEQLKQITSHFGIETELTKLSEEVGELLNECYKRHFLGDTHGEIEDELADVLVIYSQICLYFGVDMDDVQRIAETKIDRTAKRISEGWYDKHR